MRKHHKGLWNYSNFVKLWPGKTISDMGSGITGIALPLTAVLVLSATPAQTGILSALSGASVLLFSLLACVWVDRLPRRPLLIVTDVGRALLLASIPNRTSHSISARTHNRSSIYSLRSTICGRYTGRNIPH